MSDATPSEPSSGAAGRSSPRWTLLAVGLAAVVGIGVAGVVVLGGGDDDDASLSSGDDLAPTTSAAAVPDGDGASEPVDDTESADGSDDGDVVEPSDGGVAVESPASEQPIGDETDDPGDPADPYLVDTELVLTRSVDDVGEIEVRRSVMSYGELFDLEWDLPTGSADACLGRPALFVGVAPGETSIVVDSGYGQSAWGVVQEGPVGELTVRGTFTPSAPADLFVASAPGGDVAEFRSGPSVLDRADVVDGVAVFALPRSEDGLFFDGDEPPYVVVIDGDEEIGRITPFEPPTPGDPCQPPQPPLPEFPAAGEQPADPAAAEQEIRAVHARLVDQVEEFPGELAALLDDPTGVDEAVEQMAQGSFADAAASAAYTIDELVFSRPDEAWFRYTIEASSGTFGDRYGQAVAIDGTWRITRATICQDLALAGGYCDENEFTTLYPTADGPLDLNEWWEENGDLQQRYWEALECHPLNPCWRPRLPDPGEPPASPDAAAAEIEAAVTSLVDLTTPIAENSELLDDPTGVAEAAAELVDSGLAENARADSIEVVFAAPDEAWFSFDLVAESRGEDLNFGEQLGRAVLVDGSWRVTRDSMCGLLAVGGVQCEPAWTPELPQRSGSE